ncbi:MAG: MarR family transcriptional regulator [Clostridia bacterium]|nr:MarR family transcriptional regulator [Clostridia bacterium]
MADQRGPHEAGPVPMPFRSPHGEMPRHGLLPREVLLLTILELDEEGNGIRQKEIAAAVGIHAPALSEQIDRLEADRYLERRANPEDKRSTLIVLTEKGKARANEVLDERRQAAEFFCAGLTEEEQDTLLQLLDKLLSRQNDENAVVKS